MTRDEVLEHLCQTVSLVYRSKGDYSHPNDGFCHQCPAQNSPVWFFQHDGDILAYVRAAVVRQLIADGITPDKESMEEMHKSEVRTQRTDRYMKRRKTDTPSYPNDEATAQAIYPSDEEAERLRNEVPYVDEGGNFI